MTPSVGFALRKGGATTRPFQERVPVTSTTEIDNSASRAAADSACDDMALVHACKNGDAAAFEQLVKRYDRRVFRIAQHITHNREDAQDVVQEAFLKVFRKLTQFQENSQFSTWLTRIVVNESLMKLRKRSAREVPMDDPQGEEHIAAFDLADWAPNPEELCVGSELRDILRSALQDLPPGLRVVFVLRDMEGLSTEQAANVLDLTPVAVKARLCRARLQLRQRLSEHFGVGITHLARTTFKQPSSSGEHLRESLRL